jgi:hypothetical protein
MAGIRVNRLWIGGALFALLLSAGCGDDGSVSDSGMPLADGGTADASPDAGDSATPDGASDGAMDGASDTGMPPSCEEADLDHLLVVTTAADFSRARLGAIDLSDLSDATASADLSDSDSVAASAACTGFVLSRGEGVVSVVDEADPLAFTHDIDVDPAGSPGPYASNPQTLVAASATKAYVIQQARNVVTIIDPTRMDSAAVLGEIDLSPYLSSGDTDGLVDATDAIVVGDRLYVGLGNYWFDSSFAIQFEGSVLAVIDTTTDTLVDVDTTTDGIQGIDLVGENPWRGLQYLPAFNVIWVGSSGDSFARDGLIEEIDLGSMAPSGTVVTEAELSAEINGFAFISSTRVAIVADRDLVIVNPSADPIATESIGYEMDGLLLHRGTLWAWARSGEEPGLASFDAVTGAETTPAAGRFNFGDLPVFDVVAVP